MDLLLNSEHRTREYDVEKWFVCVCAQAVCLCVENNILVYRMQFPLNMPILM